MEVIKLINNKVIFSALVVVASQQAMAESTSKKIYDFMQDFHNNPREVMERLPIHSQPSSRFSDEDIKTGHFIEIKDQYRQRIIGDMPGAVINTANDDPKKVVDNPNTFLSNIYEIDQQIPRKHRLPVQPWSDSYWPIYSGGLAFRYADRDLQQTSPQNWKEYFDFSTVTKPVSDYIGYVRKDLSPAEKYDLLVGDEKFNLTKKNWQAGQAYYDKNWPVQRWEGYCHGWAPAAYMMSRPAKTITVQDASGEDLTFYPADIKALGTLLWASGSYAQNVIGGRCNIQNPKKDANGRILDQNCFDNNPGSWHIAVLNQIGLNERSLVMDATYDFQVWNQPILSYDVTYFNPQTGRHYANLSQAIVSREQYTQDKFEDYRSPLATQFVGVKMNLRYMAETNPRNREYDSTRNDASSLVSYHYDLELNNDGKIIGGEWFSNMHPDFLWSVKKGAKVRSRYNGTGVWAEGQSVPASWHAAAVNASKYNQPISSVVEELFRRSANN
ncbi:peptidase [Shewanella sp. VB17]|uniref:peptidase n=1 Tax=Shewanella sp. VB17 TaxID=2739432 RepID=UPI00156600E2|nr:peptidase [Shewanella sp. VB17]NRD75326.1 peptidase [Shewanella sp. VB17]